MMKTPTTNIKHSKFFNNEMIFSVILFYMYIVVWIDTDVNIFISKYYKDQYLKVNDKGKENIKNLGEYYSHAEEFSEED